MDKKGLSTVVTTLIIILLVLVAIGIVWVVIANVITEGSEQIFLEKFTTKLNLKNVNVDGVNNEISLNVKRDAGAGDLYGIKFIFNNGLNSEIFEEEDITLEELGQLSFNFPLGLNVADIETVSIVPIFRGKSGKKIFGGISAFYKLKGAGSVPCTDTCAGLGYNCGTVCSQNCGTCGGTEYCSGGTCIVGTNPCDLTSAVWSTSAVVEGTAVSLNIQGTDCDGQIISFIVWEDDTLSGDDPVTTQPVDITFSGSSSSGTWIAEYQADASGNPEYYFIASVVGESETITSSAPLLDVAQVAQPCDLATASWSTSTTTDGTQVTLNLVGTNCVGEAITFDIYEDDPIIDDLVSSISGFYSSTTWTATWTYAGDDDLGNDPRNYYFRATVDSNSDSVTSGDLEVARVPGTCTAEGGEVCGINYACSSSYISASDTNECCTIGDCELSSCAVCTDCEGFFSTCSYSECQSCATGSCYYQGSVVGDDCVDLSSVCGSSVTQCSDYSDEECTDDRCGLGSCEWTGSACTTITESQVSRSFSSSTVSQGGSIDVTLNVVIIGGETFYALEEYIPVGWNVTDNYGGATSDPNKLAWVIIQNAVDTTYTYTVQAPASIGNYNFDGIYQFEGANSSTTTLGQTTVTVV